MRNLQQLHPARGPTSGPFYQRFIVKEILFKTKGMSWQTRLLKKVKMSHKDTNIQSTGDQNSAENQKPTSDNPILHGALHLIELGIKVAPFKDKAPYKVYSVDDLRAQPINRLNANEYFGDAPQLAILTGEGLEMIDVDLKYDVSRRLQHELLMAIKCSLPDLFSKIVMERTVNGGLHLYYRCHTIEGNKKLAQRSAIPEELAKGEKVKVLIETRGEKGCSVCYPTPGYDLIQGEFSEIPTISAEERDFIHAICRSFNQVQSATTANGNAQSQHSRPDAPWNEFNRLNDYRWMLAKLEANGFKFVEETREYLLILRDGSSARTSGKIFKQTNILYLFSTSTQFEAEKSYTAFDVLCKLDYNNDKKSCAEALAKEGIGKWNELGYTFWEETSNGKIRAKAATILQWMNDAGYRKVRKSVDEFLLVRIKGMIVDHCSLDDLKKHFCDQLKDQVDDVRDYFIGNIGKLITKEGIISQLEMCDEREFLSTTVNTSWAFYNNMALKITPDGIHLVPYDALPGLIWSSRIIKRDFEFGKEEGMAKEFIRIISGERNEATFRRSIGYLLHSYKDPADPRVIILNDQSINDEFDEPRGGTGKGLFIQLLSKFRKTYRMDGKIWSTKKNFPYQGITIDTELIAFEDVARGFNFESLFSTITDGMVVEKKGKDEFYIPFSKSPKMLITTNYVIAGTSSSNVRRRLDIVLESHFSDNYTPYDHFGRRFFDEWDESEWNCFDNYMINCLQLFLRHGLPTVDVNLFLSEQEVIEATSRDFFTWIEKVYWEHGIPARVPKEVMLSGFVFEHENFAWGKPDQVLSRFSKWLHIWCKFRNIELDASNRYNGEMAYRFTGKLRGGDS